MTRPGLFFSNEQAFGPLFYISSLIHTPRKILVTPPKILTPPPESHLSYQKVPSILPTSLTIPITFLHAPLSLTLRIPPYIINCAVICITLNRITAFPNIISEHSHHHKWGCSLFFSIRFIYENHAQNNYQIPHPFLHILKIMKIPH